MSLRGKILLVVSLVVVAYAAADHAIQRLTIGPSFEDLERVQSERDVQRVVEAIQSEIDHLDRRCRDWGSWNDTVRFVAEPDPEYVASNLGPTCFRDARIDLLYLCNLEGRVVWGDVRDPATDQELKLHDLPSEALSPSHQLLAQNARQGRVAGLFMTEHGPLLVSSRPILSSAGEGPSRGTVILGRFLGATLVELLAARTRVDFEVWPVGADGAGLVEPGLLDRVTSSPTPVIEEVDEQTLHVYATFPDIGSAPALLLRASVPRDVSAQGATAIRYALVSTVAAGILLLLVLVLLLRILVLDAIGKLTRHAVAVGKSDDTSARLDLAREDELGILSREFDRMLEKLARSRSAQVDTARAAGMSELATGILHNVGNVLNSVNLSATLVTDRLRGSKLPRLRRLDVMLAEQAADLPGFFARDPRSKHVAPFLGELVRAMEQEQAATLEEVGRLNEGIEHIRRLVQSQQSFAKSTGLREPTELGETVDAALQLVEQIFPDSKRVELSRQFQELPRVVIDRHKLTEILVNLIKNARESLLEAAVEAPRLELCVSREGEERLAIRVRDNGAGIAPENLERVFRHGFTTKQNGHGFGLHASANAAREMHGRLSVESDGPQRGATFVLELPFEPAPTAAEASRAA